MKIMFFLLPIFLFMASCQSGDTNLDEAYGNPAAPGFNDLASDETAVEIADSVMEAMGGREAWNNTEIIKWNFFGARRHEWNKQTNEVIIEGIRDTFRIEMNLDSMTGTAVVDGRELSRTDSLDKYLQMGKEMWINDAYWLVMPYKLKDSGVTLKHLDRDTLMGGKSAEVLELTFAEVGVTPQNKYRVYVDPDDYLVKQWDYYPDATDSLPRFQIPWENYQQYGEIMLSGDRGGDRRLSEISVE